MKEIYNHECSAGLTAISSIHKQPSHQKHSGKMGSIRSLAASAAAQREGGSQQQLDGWAVAVSAAIIHCAAKPPSSAQRSLNHAHNHLAIAEWRYTADPVLRCCDEGCRLQAPSQTDSAYEACVSAPRRLGTRTSPRGSHIRFFV